MDVFCWGSRRAVFCLVILGLSFAYDFDFLDDSPKATTSCNCGWTNRARIVGGTETGKNEYPFMAVLLRAEDHHQFCGASILTQNHLLTAAHCTVDKKPEDIVIAVGAHDLSDDFEWTRHLIHVEKIVDHEKYKGRGFEAEDMSILVTKELIPFSKKIGPICLPDKRLNLDRQMIKVLGWGLTEANTDKFSAVLQEVDLRVMPRDECNFFWPAELLKDPISQICTHMKDKDSCQVDSGGPLIWSDPETGKYSQIGLVSYGGECGGMKPAVNTDVTYYLDWIKATVKATSPHFKCCEKVYQ